MFAVACAALPAAAHCSGTDGNTATNGCEAGTLPHGTPVNVDGATRPGTIVYSSWVTMQAARETDADACEYNDIALIRLDPADYGRVNPTIPFWGGPTGTATTTAQGDARSRSPPRPAPTASATCRG